MALAVQTIGGLHSNPGGVPAGNAGLVATNQPGDSTGLLVGGALALLLAALAITAVRSRALAKVER